MEERMAEMGEQNLLADIIQPYLRRITELEAHSNEAAEIITGLLKRIAELESEIKRIARIDDELEAARIALANARYRHVTVHPEKKD